MGNMAIVAPIAAVVGAASPALFSLFVEGRPDLNQGIGLAIALIGLWVVSSAGRRTGPVTQLSLSLALFAGIGFGGFFILIDQVAPGSNFLTLLIARLAAFIIALIGLRVLHLPVPHPHTQPVALLAGLLDTGGNIFFLLASQLARLDVAVVLASLYPAVTVFLARALLREKVTSRQWLGVGLCLLAIVVILV
jgi:drug/metabolite transporter (DMT)-like permease